MSGFTYILTNKNHTALYVGATSDLDTRMREHRERLQPRSFTARYNVYKLVYYEVFDSITDAIAREKQLKAGSRQQKETLITDYNPEWKDLYETTSGEDM